MTSQVVQRARPLSGHIWLLRRQRVQVYFQDIFSLKSGGKIAAFCPDMKDMNSFKKERRKKVVFPSCPITGRALYLYFDDFNFIRSSGCLLVTDCVWVFESLPNNVHPRPHPSLPLKCHPLCSHPNFRLTSGREILRSCGDACYAGYTPTSTFWEIRGNRVVNPVLWEHIYLDIILLWVLHKTRSVLSCVFPAPGLYL